MLQGHFKRARAIVEQRYRQNPKDPETLWLMAWLKQEWRDSHTAIELAEKAVAADPKNARFHHRLADALGDEAERAGKLRQFGLARRFRRELETSLALDPHNSDALMLLMEYYLQAPGILGGDKDKARAIPDQIMRFDPVEGYFARVRLARFDRHFGEIEGLYRRATEAQPANYDAQLQLGSFCGNNKKLDEAESRAREAIRIDPDRVAAHALLAAVLVHQQKWTDLHRTLAAAEEAVPDNLYPYFRAATNCISLNIELPRAEQYLRKYLGQEPEPDMPSHAVARWRLGQALEKQGRKPDAIAEYQASVNLDPNSPAKQELKRLK